MIADFAATIFPEIKTEMNERKKRKSAHRSFVSKDSLTRNSGRLPTGKSDVRVSSRRILRDEMER
jgi:hypothetical protein